MRKLFRPRTHKQGAPRPAPELVPTPIYHQYASSTRPSPPVAPAILRALDAPAPPRPVPEASEDTLSSLDLPRRSFWARDRPPHHDHDPALADLTTMIAYLTATGCQDSSLVGDVCHRASLSDSTAKEATRVLRREFKYGEPPSQLSAARLWAIMLHNCSEVFVIQSASRKFLDTILDLLTNSKTSPVVRERLLDVVAAAAFASQSRRPERDNGFRSLWRRVKPADKPDEGFPLSDDDTMLNPPLPHRSSPSALSTPEAPPPPSPQIPPPSRNRKRKSPTRNRIIPHEEDVKRLLQECKIGQGNATLLSQALVHAKPESFKKDPVIREFYRKCRASHELILTQIPWATAEAEKSIIAKEENGDAVQETTKEEQLLAAILAANEDLLGVLNEYDDLGRVALERKVEHRSLREVKMERERRQVLEPPTPVVDRRSRSSSPSARTASPSPSPQPLRHRSESVLGTLAPPPSAPFGPRLQSQHPARTPSPKPSFRPQRDSFIQNVSTEGDDQEEEEPDPPHQPSAKALGKQKAADIEPSDPYQQQQQQQQQQQHLGVETYYDAHSDRRNSHSFDDSDREEPQYEPPWHKPTHYVYDAAAERRPINGVH